VSPVKYELRFYIPEDDILHSHRRENLKSYLEAYLFTYQNEDKCGNGGRAPPLLTSVTDGSEWLPSRSDRA
jgi:hypothetical protein